MNHQGFAKLKPSNHQGLAEIKPEGEGKTEMRKGGKSTYNHPMHGEETATTAYKLLPISGSV